MLVGEDREEFQSTNLTEFKNVVTEKNITLLYGLVRYIYIPREVRTPIQTAFIADELRLTREQIDNVGVRANLPIPPPSKK